MILSHSGLKRMSQPNYNSLLKLKVSFILIFFKEGDRVSEFTLNLM